MKRRATRTKSAGIIILIGLLVGALVYFHPRPTVSVVMSTYNRAERVGQTIKSVLAQSSLDFEFIIIDDGSTDTTADALAHYAKKDSRIRILTNEKNLGLIASLNRGLDAARGTYIARIDDDDKMMPTRLEKQIAHMNAHPNTAVLATGIRTTRKGKKEADLGCPTPSAQVLINMHFANGIAHPSTMFRRDFLNKNAIRYNPSYTAAEDYKLWQDILLAGGLLDCLQEQLTEYALDTGHSSAFYQNQSHSAKQVRLVYFNRLFAADEKTLKEPSCTILKRMTDANKTKHLLDEKLLQRKLEEGCKNATDNYAVSHPNWTDSFVFVSNTRLHRAGDPSQAATLVSKKDGILTLKWDKWGTERFSCDSYKSCHFTK